MGENGSFLFEETKLPHHLASYPEVSKEQGKVMPFRQLLPMASHSSTCR